MLDFPGLVPAHLGSQPPWRSPPCPEPSSADVLGVFPATLSPLPSSCFSRAPRPGLEPEVAGEVACVISGRWPPVPPTPRVRVDRAKSACSAASPGQRGLP